VALALRRNAGIAERALGSALATFCSGINNTIGVTGRTAVTLKLRPKFFEGATNQKRERTPWMT
jgi:hypothetical protein